MIALTCKRCDAALEIDGDARFEKLAARYVRFCETCLEAIDLESQTIASEQARRLVAARVATLPAKYRGATWSDDDGRHRQAFAAAREWSVKGGTLTLLGSVGTGKTHLAAIAAKAMMEHRDVTWVSVPSLLLHLTAAHGDQQRGEAMRAITGRKALVLDDLDKTSASDWARSQLFAAIDGRMTVGSPLIVTANVTREGMAAKLGDAIASRLVGEGEVCIMAGADRRAAA